MPTPQFKGLLVPGNIDLYNRPEVRNSDGSTSTVRSISFSMDGKEVLIPTVVGNRVVSNDEAFKEYKRTGKHLGIFDSPQSATMFAKTLHNDFAAGKFRKMPDEKLVALMRSTITNSPTSTIPRMPMVK